MFRVDGPEEESRSANFFLKDPRTYRAAMDILVFLSEQGEEGIQYSRLLERMGINRILFIRKKLMPDFIRIEKRLKTIERDSSSSYERPVMYYVITPRGQEFIVELENKYKEHIMKHLYGRIV